MTNKQERRIQIKRLEALINGEVVDGLKLNDPGLRYDRVMGILAALREQERQSSRPLFDVVQTPLGGILVPARRP